MSISPIDGPGLPKIKPFIPDYIQTPQKFDLRPRKEILSDEFKTWYKQADVPMDELTLQGIKNGIAQAEKDGKSEVKANLLRGKAILEEYLSTEPENK